MKAPLFLIILFSLANHSFAQLGDLNILVQKVDPSVVKIYTLNPITQEFESQGSGVIVSSKGICVTNYHVLVGAKKAIAITASQKQFEITHIIDYSKEFDLIKFQIEIGKEVPTSAKMDTIIPMKGSSVFAVGYPNGFILEGESTVTTGIISGTRDLNGEKIIQTSAPITHGSSGGGLFNDKGQLIGITTGTFADELADRHANMNKVIPARLINGLVQNLHLSLSDFYQQLNSSENLIQGLTSYEKRDFYTAIDFFTAHLDEYPEDAVTWFRLGNSLNQIGRVNLDKDILKDALQCFNISISLDTNYYCPWGQAALVYSIMGEITNAKSYAYEAYKIEPNVSFTNYVIGKVANEAGEYSLASEFLTFAIVLASDYDLNNLTHQWYLERAIAYNLLGKDDLAEVDYLKCLELNPYNYDGSFHYGFFLANRNRINEGCKRFWFVYNNNPSYKAGEFKITEIVNNWCN
jgi:tetratricopeptide (TPR) repeat protein